jgi:hypothetical protein
MERLNNLSEVINLLLNRGYTLDFDQLTRGEHIENKPPEDFHVDEIFCCREHFDTGDAIYVFAISSERHGFKGILINSDSTETLDLWNAFSKILERLKSCLTHLLSNHELLKQRQ